jgi:hypothetical protein
MSRKERELEFNYTTRKELRSNKTSKAAIHWVNARNVSQAFQSD